MSKNIKVKGKLRVYYLIPLILGIVLTCVDGLIYTTDVKSGVILSIFTLVYLSVIIVMMSFSKPKLVNELVSFATEYGQIQKQLLKDLELPHAILDEQGHVIWMNTAFENLVHKDKTYKKSVTNLFPELTREKMPGSLEPVDVSITFEEKDFQARLKRIALRDMALLANEISSNSDYDGFLVAVYLYDQTALNLALREIDDQSLCVGLIYIDNYEEAMESVEDVAKSLLSALIDRQINQCVASIDGIVRKTEKDKYLLIIRKSALKQLENERFKLLEDVKAISIGNETAVTLSIGIGFNGLSFAQNCEFARNAIDLALGRGGDQTVVKSASAVTYYGGKSQQKESNARVKARVKAHALEEIISSKDMVFVMGHRDGDVDSFGASVGIMCACSSLQKECHIVLDTVSTSLQPLVELYKTHPEYSEDSILTGAEALEIANGNTVLVIVDVNRPSITECPELIRRCKSIVVLDHHRQGTEVVENATLSYVEPYASSACEMVAEILQYINGGIKIKSIIADCLYSGIIIDTQNFATKAGVRTFEAAAFLRRNGADVTRVRKMFREDAQEYKTKADAVRNAEIYKKDYAISVCNYENIKSPTVLAAQAANELLNINGIKASFVMTDYQNKIYISARSIDEVNVQIIMEKLGGGGHMNIAGAQLEGTTVEAVTILLKNTLDKMIQEGEI
ncbi:MAG: DHH family phosphoesterase [Lachnospiraceae bacterium]